MFLYTGKLLAGGGGRSWIEGFSLTELRQINVSVWKKSPVNRECPTRLQRKGWRFFTFMHFLCILCFIRTHTSCRMFSIYNVPFEAVRHKRAVLCFIAVTLTRKNCIVILLYMFPSGNANLELIQQLYHLNIFKKSLYFQPYEQKVQKFIIGYTK